jgi:hypothetical protein
MPDPIVQREMRELYSRLDAMEIAQKETVDAGDVNESKNENEARLDEEETAVEHAS